MHPDGRAERAAGGVGEELLSGGCRSEGATPSISDAFYKHVAPTALNRLFPHLKQTVSEVSNATQKGTHTTTFAEMFLIDTSTFVIDTPGVKEWGLSEMRPQEISDYFPEMRELRLECKFGSRCLHVNEPKCAILQALEDGGIAPSRYDSYFSIVSGGDNRK